MNKLKEPKWRLRQLRRQITMWAGKPAQQTIVEDRVGNTIASQGTIGQCEEDREIDRESKKIQQSTGCEELTTETKALKPKTINRSKTDYRF